MPAGSHLALALLGLWLLLGATVTANVAKVPPSKRPTESPGAAEPEVILGLYHDSPLVHSLTHKTVRSFLFDRKKAVLMQFYNSYCGHCRRFSPTYKAIAKNITDWSSLVEIGALDCAVGEHTDVCREFEVMGYPTIRYFSPGYTQGPNQTGVPIMPQLEPDPLIDKLTSFLQAETKNPPGWPNFHLADNLTRSELLQSTASGAVPYTFVFCESSNTSLLAAEVILDLTQLKIPLRPVLCSSRLAQDLQLKEDTRLAVLPRDGGAPTLLPVAALTRADITASVYNFLVERNAINPAQVPMVTEEQPRREPIVPPLPDMIEAIQGESILERVRSSPGTVYYADLEKAVRHALFVEVPRFNRIEGERLTALQRFVRTLDQYFPFGANGKAFIKDLRDFVMNQEMLDGGRLEARLKEIADTHRPVFSSDRWVGCLSDKEGLRRFPCSLWTLFHHLTVAAAESEASSDPLEVLSAMHGYIKFYFGCSECSEHFQAMAARNKIWSVTSKDDAILWLWSSHNEVNARLSGDVTEDSQFPKIQFPSERACAECRREPGTGRNGHAVDIDAIDWDRAEVLAYLKTLHSPANVSRLGVQEEAALPRFMAYSSGGERGDSRGVFSELDIRMGLVLYVGCIAMMVIAVKLFLRRGYRKKMYVHDILGKV